MAVLAAVCAVSAGMTATAYGAESTFEMKKKVVSLLGILTTSDRNAEVTREEFAGMLVKASSQRQSYGAAVTGAVFADVAAGSQYASAIRTASSNEWMSGFLGGNFKPEEALMSGSGPTVFGIFKDREEADAVCGILRETDNGRLTRQVYLTRFFNKKPAR